MRRTQYFAMRRTWAMKTFQILFVSGIQASAELA